MCEIDFVKQNPKVTAALIRDLRSQTGDWQKRYQVKLSSSTRDVKGLAILTSQEQEQKLKGGFEGDLLVDQLGPEDLAVSAEAEQQPGGDLLGEPRAVPPEERRGVRAQLRGPVHTVDDLAADQN